MKKLLILVLCLSLAGLLAVNGTFAMSDVSSAFQKLTDFLGDLGMPQHGGNKIDVQIISDNTPQILSPGTSATRTVYVKNQGSDPAYFRFAIAVQYDEETWNDLTIAFNTEGYSVSDWTEISVSNTPYRMKVFTYEQALGSDSASPEIAMTVSMKADVTSEQLARYRSDFIQMKVLAIETDSFKKNDVPMSASDALNMALPLQSFNPF